MRNEYVSKQIKENCLDISKNHTKCLEDKSFHLATAGNRWGTQRWEHPSRMYLQKTFLQSLGCAINKQLLLLGPKEQCRENHTRKPPLMGTSVKDRATEWQPWVGLDRRTLISLCFLPGTSAIDSPMEAEGECSP